MSCWCCYQQENGSDVKIGYYLWSIMFSTWKSIPSLKITTPHKKKFAQAVTVLIYLLGKYPVRKTAGVNAITFSRLSSVTAG
jgi:hypothetical protein